MQTHFAGQNDLSAIAKLMRKAGSDNFRSKAACKQYLQIGRGKIFVTHDDAGHVYAIVFYRVFEDDPWAIRYLSCEAVLLDVNETADTEQAARSAGVFLRALLDHEHAQYAQTIIHDLQSEYLAQLLAIGFLQEEMCPDCGGGSFVFANDDEHAGGLIIERLLAGNAKVLAEV